MLNRRGKDRFFAWLLASMIIISALSPLTPAQAASTNDSDGDGIPDLLEGYCPTATLFEATPGFSWDADNFVDSTKYVETLNPSGGMDANSLAISVDATSREQVRFNGKYNFWLPTKPFENEKSYNNTSLILDYNGSRYHTNDTEFRTSKPFSGGALSPSFFKPLSVSQPIGNGLPSDPYRIQVKYYADVNRSNSFESSDDILIKQVYSYVTGTTYYRRDFKLEIGANLTVNASTPIKVYEWRDAYFAEYRDAGSGFYALDDMALHVGSGKVEDGTLVDPSKVKILGINEYRDGGDTENAVFMGFMAITPFSSVQVNRYDLPVYDYGGIVNAKELDNRIANYNSDIGYSVKYPDIIAGGTQIISGFSVFNKGPFGCLKHRDTDLDGIPDYLDLDSDNDKIPDVLEAGLFEDPENHGKLHPVGAQATAATDLSAVTTVDIIAPTFDVQMGTDSIIGTVIQAGPGDSLQFSFTGLDDARQSIDTRMTIENINLGFESNYTESAKQFILRDNVFKTEVAGNFVVKVPIVMGTYTITVEVEDDAGLENLIAAETQRPGNKASKTFTIEVIAYSTKPIELKQSFYTDAANTDHQVVTGKVEDFTPEMVTNGTKVTLVDAETGKPRFFADPDDLDPDTGLPKQKPIEGFIKPDGTFEIPIGIVEIKHLDEVKVELAEPDKVPTLSEDKVIIDKLAPSIENPNANKDAGVVELKATTDDPKGVFIIQVGDQYYGANVDEETGEIFAQYPATQEGTPKILAQDEFGNLRELEVTIVEKETFNLQVSQTYIGNRRILMRSQIPYASIYTTIVSGDQRIELPVAKADDVGRLTVSLNFRLKAGDIVESYAEDNGVTTDVIRIITK